MSGGGSPSRLLTELDATTHETPAKSAAKKAAMTSHQKRRATMGSESQGSRKD